MLLIRMEISLIPQRSADYVQEIVNLHLDSENGSPYIIERAAKLGIKQDDVSCLEDLVHFGPTSPDLFRELPIQKTTSKWALRKAKEDPRYSVLSLETGGTTGKPKRSMWLHSRDQYGMDLDPYDWDTAYYNLVLTQMMKHMDAAGVPEHLNYLMMVPSGPHAIGSLILEVPRFRGGWSYSIDLDPRWIKKAGISGDMQGVGNYLKHIQQQSEAIIQQEFPYIGGVFTTSVILEKMYEALEAMKEKGSLQSIIHGGTPMSRETHRLLREDLGVSVIGAYGMSLIGVLYQHWESDNFSLDYYPTPGRMFVDVISDPNDISSRVDYGERGTAVATRVSPDVLIPNLVQHGDIAERIPPKAPYNVDGLRDPGREVRTAQMGVY